MLFSTTTTFFVAAVAFAIPATCQNTTDSTSNDLVSLIDELPTCALSCLEESAASINCTTSDLTCLCDKSSQLISSIAPCVLLSSCDSTEQSELSSIATELCSDVDSASSSDIAAASSAVVSAIASASTTAGASSTASGNAAARTDMPIVGMGVMGAAAAFAALAL